MPLREDLLQPIPGDNPSGKSLRYDRVYDQIKEARTEEDESLPSGAWERQAKRADFNLVIKLAGEALATKSKDLQLAAWLGEAHIKKEGAALISPVLTLFLNLQKEFWDTIYPEIDEGDAGLRAVPVQWAANRYATLVYELPVTKSGINYFNYKSARALGYAADAQNNEAKQKQRDLALKRGQLTAEDLDEALKTSPKSLYAELDPLLQESRDVLEELAVFCEEKYADDGPSFRKLRDSLEEVHNLVNSLLSEKRKTDPDPVPVAAAEPQPESPPAPVASTPEPVAAAPVAAAPAAPAPVAAAPAQWTTSAGGGAPASWDEASARVHACALYMSAERPGSWVPYLLHSSIRWGEVRRHAPKPPLDLFVPPPAEIRSTLKVAAAENKWNVVLSSAMKAMAEPCARCWMDVHRYIWKATKEMGYAMFSSEVVAAVQDFLKHFPEAGSWTFMDDTPVANAETLKWLEEEVAAGAAAATPGLGSPAFGLPPQPVAFVPRLSNLDSDAASGAEESDVFAEAASLAAGGDLNAATMMLMQDATRQTSGRMRYRRRVEIAELCLAAGSPGVAAPILRELVDEIERRSLDTWETGEMIARPVALLLRSMNGDRGSEWETNFARLCRLDPAAALAIAP